MGDSSKSRLDKVARLLGALLDSGVQDLGLGGVGVLGDFSSTRLHTCCSWSSFTGLAGGARRTRRDALSTARRPLTTGAREGASTRRGHGARSQRPTRCPCLALRPLGKLRKCRGLLEQHWWCFQASNSDLVCV